MYEAVLFFCMLKAVAFAMPNSVEMFNIEPAKETVRLSFDSYEKTWESFKLKHSKSYGSSREESDRKAIFMQNVKKIELHNWEYANNLKSYYLDINQFADMTFTEYQHYNGLNKTVNKTRFTKCSKFQPPLKWQVPVSVDWRQEGYVTPIKNQGDCGSCWSFSATGSLEGQHFRKNGKLISLSEQQLIDCSVSYGNTGCQGGLMDFAFVYIGDVGGLESEDEYPYTARDGKCLFNKTGIVANLTGCVDVESESEQALMEAVGSQGPVSVGIDASLDSFQFYKGGIYSDRHCSSRDLDHGVLVVGYGSQNGHEYWIVKNSWGVTWGMEGYILMARNKNNMCGIATEASYPVV